MTGIDTRVDSGTATSQGVSPDDLFALLSSGFDSSDPNDSVELQDMVELASAYYDRGKLDDARDLIEEALDSGYSRPEALALREQVRAAQRTLMHETPPAPTQQQRRFVGFTSPLPGVDTLPSASRAALATSDADIAAGRLQSALDSVMRAIALAPSFLPGYIRLAELREALGDEDSPDAILTSLTACLRLSAESPDPIDLSLRIILNPDDTGALVELARTALRNPGSIQIEPYVPNAIERTLDSNPATAKELATAYVAVRPNAASAVRNHALALLACGNVDEAVAALIHEAQPDSRSDVLTLRALAGYRESRASWTQWLERAVARILAYPTELTASIDVIVRAREMIPASQAALTEAILRLAGNDANGALTALSTVSGSATVFSNAQESLLARCVNAFALEHQSPIESIEALTLAVGEAVVIDVREFAVASRLFRTAITAESLMHDLVQIATTTGQQQLAITNLQRLRDRLPEHLEIRTGLADLQIASGHVSEGVKELRHIAERYEHAGNIDRMVDAMRRISNAVPANAEIKAMLIDAYVHRGVPDEARRELHLLGDLYQKRSKHAEAAQAYRRGAEIAATTGQLLDASTLFEKAVEAEPGDVAYRHAAVAFHIMNGAVDKATPHLREIVRLAIERDDPDEAVAALHQIIGLAPNDTAAYHRLGEVLTSLGEYAQAERVYRRLGTIVPEDPVLVAKQSALAALAAS
jgi:tetratricopeptide (TPR) repeat protein